MLLARLNYARKSHWSLRRETRPNLCASSQTLTRRRRTCAPCVSPSAQPWQNADGRSSNEPVIVLGISRFYRRSAQSSVEEGHHVLFDMPMRLVS